jgi:uncharacterized protein YjiK
MRNNMPKLKHLLLAAIAASAMAAQAASTLNLANYTVTNVFALDILNGTSGGISGLEASAVAYARDRGTLFFVGDEGTGVVETSLSGVTLGTMQFNWAGTGSTKNDTEGLTYVGNGVLVVGEERLQDAYRFTYAKDGTAMLASSFVSISNMAVGNNGMEGISYDARNGGSFVTIKQQSPQDIRAGTLTFAPATGGLPPSLAGNGVSPTGGGASTMANLFNASLMGLTTLSDVQTLSGVDALTGTAGADNLLVLSLGSKQLVEVDRSGNVLSFLDLSTVAPNNAIEGLTIDEKGVIYLVAEQIQTGVVPPNAASQLIVLTPVPEPDAFAMMLAGLGMLGWIARRRQSRV